MEIKKQMSEGLRNKLLENEKIYSICLDELKNKNKVYPGEFTYPEALEFSVNLKILRDSNLKMIKDVMSRIKRYLKANTRGLTKIKIKEIEKRKLNSQIKLDKHLNKLKELKNSHYSGSTEQ